MTNYAVTTKIIISDGTDARADSVTGSTAKAVSDYINGLVNSKTIRAITSNTMGTNTVYTIIHDT